MLRSKPILPYKGLTIILSNPSRLDDNRLLKGTGGLVMNDCLQPFCNPMQCDVRLCEDESEFIEGTKCILLLGEKAMHYWCPMSRGNSLNEFRGSPLEVKGIPAYASFLPQDAADIRNYEKENNPFAQDYKIEGNEEGDDDSDEGDSKEHSITKRSNYYFWLRADTQKCIKVINNEYKIEPRATYNVIPQSKTVITILKGASGCYLDFDIETDWEEQNLLCFAFSVDNGKNVYSVPILDHQYQLAYGKETYEILRALSIAFKNNIVVAHNGASFDFHVLATKYGICVNKSFDTMICNHRCFPDIEKSLGHGISYWTNLMFHKDTDSQKYYTYADMLKKLEYCGKDVFGMSLVRQAQQEYIKTIPGLSDSVDCAMDSIRPYLTCSIQGIRFDDVKRQEIMKENDRLLNQYLRIIRILIGENGLEECRRAVKKATGAFPSSNPQVCRYFHELLGYDVIGRSRETQNPSLGKKAMYRLALKYPENPVITFVLLYRTVKKEYSSLKFQPWKGDDDKIIKITDDTDEDSGDELSSSQKALFFGERTSTN